MVNKLKEKIQRWVTSKRYNWRNYDITLVVVVLLLSLISSYVLSLLNIQNVGSFKRQFITVTAGLFIIAVFSLIDTIYCARMFRFCILLLQLWSPPPVFLRSGQRG